jgi:hypothetical protein
MVASSGLEPNTFFRQQMHRREREEFMLRRSIALIAAVIGLAACGSATAQTPAQRDCSGPDPERAVAA